MVGKAASLAAIALTFGEYAWPANTRPVAGAAVIAMTAVNYRGVEKTALVTRLIVALVLAALAAVVVASLFGGTTSEAHIDALLGSGGLGVLRSAGLLFFAFAAYARIATLGEEVVDPARTIPRAIPLALGLTLIVYTVVPVSALAAAGSVDPGPRGSAARRGGRVRIPRMARPSHSDRRHGRVSRSPGVAPGRREQDRVLDGAAPRPLRLDRRRSPGSALPTEPSWRLRSS
jgi:Amino acid permease